MLKTEQPRKGTTGSGNSSTKKSRPAQAKKKLPLSGSEKGVFRKRGHFRKVHALEILENSEILETLEKPPDSGK